MNTSFSEYGGTLLQIHGSKMVGERLAVLISKGLISFLNLFLFLEHVSLFLVTYMRNDYGDCLILV